MAGIDSIVAVTGIDRDDIHIVNKSNSNVLQIAAIVTALSPHFICKHM
jgi:hypothetical protein